MEPACPSRLSARQALRQDSTGLRAKSSYPRRSTSSRSPIGNLSGASEAAPRFHFGASRALQAVGNGLYGFHPNISALAAPCRASGAFPVLSGTGSETAHGPNALERVAGSAPHIRRDTGRFSGSASLRVRPAQGSTWPAKRSPHLV